jgi:putative nucleotidyltransferase with HDIG domain
VGLFVAPSGKLGTPLACRDIVLISMLLLVFCGGAKALYIFALYFQDPDFLSKFSYAYPVGGVTGIVSMVFAARRYCTFSLLMSLFCTVIFRGNPALFLFYFLSGMFATWLMNSAQNRQDIVWAFIPHLIAHLVLWFGVTLLVGADSAEYPGEIVALFVNSIATLSLLFAVAPVLEVVFSHTTRFRLMELMNLDQPLLQELMLTVPGTYHHSLLVANLVEAGAKAVGANSLLCKVGALFHDIGKVQYPDYFIENQLGGVNKHDKLAPSMSVLILSSHVKKGVEIARANKLGDEIVDIIEQHHGTRLMGYFYQKALAVGESPRQEEYSYAGPKPQSKEAAIVMLADVAEASTRTLSDPTPARIAGHIDKILKGVFAEGQLDDSELTFQDLHKLGESFTRILTGLFHQRIVYPDAKTNGVKGQVKTAGKVETDASPASASGEKS